MSSMDVTQSTALLVTCVCLLGPVLSFEHPIYLWPFSNWTIAYDIQNQVDAEYPQKERCPSFADGPPDLDYKVFDFNGNKRSMAQMKTNSEDVKDITLVFMVYPENKKGVILDYKASNNKDDNIERLTVELDDGLVQVTIKAEKSWTIKATDSFELRKWVLIYVSKNEGCYKLRLECENQTYTYSGNRKCVCFHYGRCDRKHKE